LEKHKDYKERAKNYHSKQRRLKSLKEKAAFRNPDEFYYKMLNTQSSGGVHTVEEDSALSEDIRALLKTRDISYLHMKRASELKVSMLMYYIFHKTNQQALLLLRK
jgi:U3 small nucleolar RNA-associated protein 11